MTSDSVETNLFLDTEPNIADTIEQCLQAGFKSEKDDNTETWDVHTNEERFRALSTPQTIEALERAEWGWIRGWIGWIPIRVIFGTNPGTIPPEVESIAISTPELYLEPDEEDSETAVHRYLNFIIHLYEYLEPWYGYGLFLLDGVGLGDEQPDFAAIRTGEIETLFWLNLFPPGLVDSIGRSKLEGAPAERVERLDDGGVLLLTNPYPSGFGTINDQSIQVADSLGLSFPGGE